MTSEFRDAAAERRKQLAAMLLRGEKVTVAQSGQIQPITEIVSGEASITIPEGKLAAKSLYWYDNDPELLKDETAAMGKYFPQFRPDLLPDKRMSWVGSVSSGVPGSTRIWILQATYDHDHPHAKGYGGSIVVVPIDPALEDLAEEIDDNIPHTMTTVDGSLAICTVEEESFLVERNNVNGMVERCETAVSSIARAVKWIAAFELWMLGEISTEMFSGHSI